MHACTQVSTQFPELMSLTLGLLQRELVVAALTPPCTMHACTQVSTQFPELMSLTLGLLMRELVVVVPMSFVQEPGALTPEQWRRLVGYRELEGPDGTKVFEDTDELLKRVEGLMLLYGAIVQVRGRRGGGEGSGRQ
jgi:hypothetical protein